ncbi:hypothetical protein DTO013E5_6915 [Penicillium roqueforti]|uniref:Nicotinamide N-methyltransferase-like n=1 Tax=Penicillium roqueforti (strain FM164) TaxID=1365484 RepID=W6PT28_PENRF|nr:uncharacterized protein LCP9604111_8271 [Penicillium roqueforti]CDM26896.1 Nicotinamide N-methyltransferase-like [Penicillium roqueforti FM164]KAF9241662.1 hypothetical protein LCP9604111_8271 [Penicillium roqueforti]KAI1833650.1 hypothetical protein CBS147337_5689 [Penicillium roqueforti]KAI2699363.1 hypothetical protein CBS147354_9815 [Penicillium roqueforti]KAI2703175.1 hypothetical protein CBS147372_3490 [Penicillium roqueforti]
MVYYVRFLKTPRIQQQKGAIYISALICITTDLGDSFLAEDVDLMVIAENSSRVIFQKTTKWNASNRELAITLGPLPSNLAQQSMVLTVKMPDSPEYVIPQYSPIQLVVAATSAPFGPHSTPAEKLVQRRLQYSGCEPFPMEIWEETGNSIARHIWDAGLATVTYLHLMCEDIRKTARNKNKGPEPKIQALKQVLSVCNRPIQVVELGAGCGIAGIALASMLPNCSVLLTDLPEVEEIITRNMNVAQLATMSSLHYQNLDWDDPPDELCPRPIDLILVSDCTYNSDSLPALVSTLDRLVRTSPEAIVLVALKRRHDSETVFFDLMRSARFTAVQDSVEIPSQHDEVDEIEFYCYSRLI